MSIIIRNESRGEVIFTYNNEKVELAQDSYVIVEDIDTLLLDECVVKLRNGIIKIKRMCK